MKVLLTESVGEIVILLATTIASFGFTLLGMVAELAALQNVFSGHTVVGVWEAGIGILALLVGIYLLGYRELWSRVQRLRTET